MNRGPLFGGRGAIAAALVLLAGLSPSSTGPPSLPDSVATCVPCHNRGDRDQVSEWLDSPYSETEGGRGCSDCHDRRCSGNEGSRTLAEDLNAAGPLPTTEAARLTVRAICSGDNVTAEVAVSNVGVGHFLPTGSAKRSLILEVAAHDQDQVPLPPGDDETSHRAVNRTVASVAGRVPVYRTPVRASVTLQPRLHPFATHVSRYRFIAPERGPVRVSARLVLIPAAGPSSEIANTATVCSPSGEEP